MRQTAGGLAKLSVQIPQPLLEEIDRRAAERGVSRSMQIAEWVRRGKAVDEAERQMLEAHRERQAAAV